MRAYASALHSEPHDKNQAKQTPLVAKPGCASSRFTAVQANSMALFADCQLNLREVREPSAVKLTKLDRDIIAYLATDARMPALRIAETLDVPESTVRGRLSRLIDSGVIEFVAQTDPSKIGFQTWVMIGLKISLPKISTILKKLEVLPEIYFIAVTTGGFDIQINALFADNEALYGFVKDKLGPIDGIKETTTFHYISVPKRRFAIVPPQSSNGAEE